MHKRFWIILVLFWALSPACSPLGKESLEERMQAVLDRGVARYDIHGVSAAVIFPDVTIWKGVSGFSHNDTKITTDMVFAIGSITKNVVAALTLKLVEDGTLALCANCQCANCLSLYLSCVQIACPFILQVYLTSVQIACPFILLSFSIADNMLAFFSFVYDY